MLGRYSSVLFHLWDEVSYLIDPMTPTLRKVAGGSSTSHVKRDALEAVGGTVARKVKWALCAGVGVLLCVASDAWAGGLGLYEIGAPDLGTAAAGRAALGRKVQIGVRFNDDAGIASKFEDHFFLSALLFEPPADRGAARKAQQLEALVNDQALREPVVAWQHVKSPRREAGLERDLSEQQGGQGSLRRWFDQFRIPCRQGRRATAQSGYAPSDQCDLVHSR